MSLAENAFLFSWWECIVGKSKRRKWRGMLEEQQQWWMVGQEETGGALEGKAIRDFESYRIKYLI